MKHAPSTTRLRARVVIAALVTALAGALAAHAADSVTATKTRELDGTYSSTPASFSIATPQIVAWEAVWTGEPTEGNDFYVFRPGQPLDDIPFSTNLTGFDSGTHYLEAGTYSISVEFFGMGPGTYTVTYNRTASVALSPASHPFGNLLAGESSSSHTFTISSTGDVGVRIDGITSSDPGHFELSGLPVGQEVPGNRTFEARFHALTDPGYHSATITVTGSAPSDPSLTVSNATTVVSGTTLPREPDVACAGGGTTHLGSADWFTSEVRDFSYAVHNDGDADLVLASVDLINDSPGNAFSLAMPPSSPVPDHASRNATIRFTPPATAVEGSSYTGHMVIASNDPDEPSKSCSFSATAHHPAPLMRLESTTLDYGEVELGFELTRAVIVYNDGDLPLTVGIEDISTGTPFEADLEHWSALDLGTATVPPAGDPAVFLQVYSPRTLAVHTIRLRANSDSFVDPVQDVTLTGEGIAPVPIDSVLVLDRSGSMEDPAGPRQKIEVMRVAADLFTHLLRPEIPGADTGDRIGYVRYNKYNDVYLPLDRVGAEATPGSHLEEAETKLSDDALTDVARLGPDGRTGIGGAMETASGMFPLPGEGSKHVMVVLTDGKENESPWILDVKDGLVATDPDLMMYSVGLGDDFEPDKLQAITNAGPGGYHQVAADLSGTAIFDLELFYFKIFSNATGLDLVVDPTRMVELSGDGPIVVDTARVISSDRSAVFLVLDLEALRPFYTLELVDPHGNVIDLDSSVGGVPVHVLQRYNYTIYKLVFPDATLAPTYVGTWTLRLTPSGRWPAEQVTQTMLPAVQLASSIAPVGFAAAVDSGYRLAVEVTPSAYLPGADVRMSASLSDRGWPAVDGTVEVDVTNPEGTLLPGLRLFDDGTHGDAEAADGTWTGHFNQTATPGAYRFDFHAVGRNQRGELAPREATRFVSLTSPPQNPTEGPCIPCWLQWLAWALALLLLLVLLFLVLRCCGRLKD